MRARLAPARPCPAARLSAVALVLVFALGQLGSFAHLALVRHGRCAEHGELIDVHAGARGEPPLAVVPPGEGACCGPAALAGADHHDHCAAATQRREQGAAVGPQDGLSLLRPVALRPPHAWQARDWGAGAVYRLAPKTSPPA